MRTSKVRGEEGRSIPPSHLLAFSPSHLVTFLLLSCVCPTASASFNAWHVPGAVLKFTIEADPNRPLAPKTSLSELQGGKGDWPGNYYRVDGTVHKNVLALTCPAKATYRCKEEVRRFVATVGLREDANPAALVMFEVFAGERKLFSSPPMSVYSAPVGIDVRIAPKTKEIRLVTSGSDLGGRHWACWINAGVLLTSEYPRAGHVVLPVPGYDPAKHEVMIFTPNGMRAAEKRLAPHQEGCLELLFFARHAWSTYYAYVVPKDRYEPPPMAWEPDAGLLLETRRVDKKYQGACEDLGGLRKVWTESGETVGLSLVTGLHHGYPVHPRLMDAGQSLPKDSLALYHYTGFFEAEVAGEYIFATASNWGSHLLVDGKAVVSWPGRHDYREGIKGQKQGKLALGPGIHKLDYFNYSPWGTMLTLAAWQPPGGTLGVMTDGDFVSVQGFVAAAVEHDPSAQKKPLFEWDVVDDWRVDCDKVALIRMRFHAVPDRKVEDAGQKTEDRGQKTEDSVALRSPSSAYRWVFDDGISKTGRTIDRVFLTPGRHTVTVQMLQDNKVIAENTQAVYAGTRADKIWVDPRDPEAFKRGIAEINLRKSPIPDVVNLYAFSGGVQESPWRDAAVQTLVDRVDEVVSRSEYHGLCLELAEYLISPTAQRYDQAMGICQKLQERTPEGAPIRLPAMIMAGELALRCLGKPDAALRLLNQARWAKTQDKAWTIRLCLARAEALLALGQQEDLVAQMRQLDQLRGPLEPKRQAIGHAGLLRQASALAQTKEDPIQWDYAMDNLQTILREDPSVLLSPAFNIVRLDVHLARGEHKIARCLAERLAKLEMTPYDRAHVLLRHVKALCAMGDPSAATKILEQLNQVHPNSQEASEARTVIVETAAKTRAR